MHSYTHGFGGQEAFLMIFSPLPSLSEVRLRQLTSRIKVLHIASSVSRPADLAPKVGPVLGPANLLQEMGILMESVMDLQGDVS